jgi:hypothetical protein
MENRTIGIQQLPFVCCKWKMKTENFRLFSANGNVKRKFVFLGRQTINGNRRLLFSKNAHLQYAHDYVQGLPMSIYFSGL